MIDSHEGPIQVVEAFLESFAAMDLDPALPILSHKVECTNVPIGTVYGHAGARRVLETFVPTHENEFVLIRRAASGPVVFLERLDRHRPT